MTREKTRAHVTPAILNAYAELLRGLAEAHDDLAKGMEKSGISELDTPIVKTAVDGLEALSKYLGEAFRCYQEHKIAEGVRELGGAVADLKQRTGRTKEQAKLMVKGPSGIFAEDRFSGEAKELARDMYKKSKGK